MYRLLLLFAKSHAWLICSVMTIFQVAYIHHVGSLSLPTFCEFERVQLPPLKCRKYLFHVALTSKNPVTMRVSGFFLFYTHSKNHLIFGCSFHSFGKNSPSFYSLHFSATVSHLLPKSTVSGNAIPLTIACADDSLEL